MIPIYKRKIISCIFLSIITLGIYKIYWMYLLVKNTRAMQGDTSKCTKEMLCLLFVPFYSLFWWVTRGHIVSQTFAEHGCSPAGDKNTYLLLNLVGLGFLARAIMQYNFNSLSIEVAQELLPSPPKTLIYILKRIGLALLTIWVVITVTFFVMHAVPGGPFTKERAISASAQAALEAKYGLDKPLFEQYLTYLEDIVTRFDFGPSMKHRGRMVIDIIMDGLKTSAKLGVIAAVMAAVFGVVLGAWAALRRNKLIDKIIMVLTTAFVSMPSFIMGSLLLVLFSVTWRLVPANGAQAGGLILPIITLSLYPMAYITRLTRSSMLDVLGQDYIRTAKAKGVSGPKIIFGHALKNSLIPVITYFGPMLAYIVTGSLVVEQIFAVPGIGRAFITSITSRNYTLIMGTTIVLAVLIVVMNLISDILYKVVDPRINLE